MHARSLVLVPWLILPACSADRVADRPSARAAQAQLATAPPSIFALAAAQAYTLPDISDDMAAIDDLFHPDRTVSLRDALVIGAWATAPTASGDPPALVYHCGVIGPDADAGDGGDAGDDDTGDALWTTRLDTGLVPLGVDPATLASALPFTATSGDLPPAGMYLFSPSGPAWTVDGQVGTGPSATLAHTQLVGDSDMWAESPNPDSVPLTRYHKIGESRSSFLVVPTVADADYVLELDTVGGLGPDDEGAPCDPASDVDTRSEFSAELYFVRVPWTRLH